MFDMYNCFTAVLTTGVIPQDITTQAASTNYIDLDVANVRIAGGKGQFLIVRVGTAFTASSATGLDIRLETDTASGFATALKQVFSVNIPNASLTAGKLLINQQLPVQKYQRYMRLYFNPVGGDVTYTAGSLIAYLQDHPEPAEAQLDQTELS